MERSPEPRSSAKRIKMFGLAVVMVMVTKRRIVKGIVNIERCGCDIILAASHTCRVLCRYNNSPKNRMDMEISIVDRYIPGKRCNIEYKKSSSHRVTWPGLVPNYLS